MDTVGALYAVAVELKVNVDLYWIALCREHTSKTLRYGTCSQGISQFYMHTPRSFVNGMNHIPAFTFPADAGTHLPTPEGWKADLALGG